VRHHRAVHDRPDGTAHSRRPNGQPHHLPRAGAPPLAPTLVRLDNAGITIGPKAGSPDWHGERLDETWAIDVLWRPRPTGVDPAADGR
tara:strand:- start:974 stop:1237 length:264 start_codon:yes stop_codon:yes gene_type:complete